VIPFPLNVTAFERFCMVVTSSAESLWHRQRRQDMKARPGEPDPRGRGPLLSCC
jgi:hypothetical protein